MDQEEVFITGGTGYIGSRLIKKLIEQNYRINAIVRHGSENKLPSQVNSFSGNALDGTTFSDKIPSSTTFVHLVGVAHPSPQKKLEFIDIDLKSIQESVNAARGKDIRHFIYMSVAPSQIMKEYSDVRQQGEKLVRENFPNATFLRPFYVLGPAHYWPLLLAPVFKILSLTRSGKEKAKQHGLVWIGQMVNALLWSIQNPAQGVRILEVNEIRKFEKKY